MVLKRRGSAKELPDAELDKTADQIANRMADKVYGDDPLPSGQEKTQQRRRITLSLNKANVQAIEEIANLNKTNELEGPKNASGIIDIALKQYLERHHKLNKG